MGYITNEQSEDTTEATDTTDDNDVLFLYELREGPSENSFAINVGKMAGLPPAILKRAREISEFYESKDKLSSASKDKNEYGQTCANE